MSDKKTSTGALLKKGYQGSAPKQTQSGSEQAGYQGPTNSNTPTSPPPKRK